MEEIIKNIKDHLKLNRIMHKKTATSFRKSTDYTLEANKRLLLELNTQLDNKKENIKRINTTQPGQRTMKIINVKFEEDKNQSAK